MVRLLFPIFLVAVITMACGGNEPSAKDLEGEAEADRIEAVTSTLESSVEEVEASTKELSDALDSLEVLFPQEQ
jgi:hypothetical protein